MKYDISFNGREVGAIGIMYRCYVRVEADDAKAALLKVYDTHEHLSDVSIRVVPTKEEG